MNALTDSSRAANGTSRRRIVLVPYPFQGHLTPMLQLGSILHDNGFSVAVAYTKFNSPNLSNYPDFTFLPLSDNLDGCDASFYDLLSVITALNKNCEASLEEHLVEMMQRGGVACVIYDNIMRFVDAVAYRLEIPTIVLRTTSAAFMHSHVAVFQLAKDGIIPLSESDSRLHDPVPNLPPLRLKDLPFGTTETIPELVKEFLQSYMNIRSSSAVIWNTLEALDRWPLQQLQHHWPVPFFTIGPFHKMAPPLPTSLMEEDSFCLSWLDKQTPNSVIYVSLGSVAILDEKELLKMAWGLAKSHHPFLWVVRPSLLEGNDAFASLPEDFKSEVRERGLIVKWAPQRKVLEHPAVGGFLSHCGWNSIMESLSAGVPMICKPCFSDQMVNARYLTHVWQVGLELEKSIEQAVCTLMDSDSGRDMRERASEMKLDIERSMKQGGSSFDSLDQLVKFIASL